MKNIINRYFTIFCLAITFLIFSIPVSAKTKKVNAYLFYSRTCPHCAKEREFLAKIEEFNYEKVVVYEFESGDNANLLFEIGEKLNADTRWVPFLVVGEEVIIGYGGDSSTGKQIVSRIEACLSKECEDPVYSLLSEDQKQVASEKYYEGDDYTIKLSEDSGYETEDENQSSEFDVEIPLLGAFDSRKMSLPVLTLVLALLDGFNPCAMWVLLFLISLLLGMKDKKKMWILGLVFIFISALVYFLFLSAWLNLFLFIGYIDWIRIVVAIVAIASGILHFRSYFKSKGSCQAIGEKRREKVFTKLREITTSKKFVVSIIGIVLLAISVNFIELVCSAGLPAIYTRVLTLSNLSTVAYYLYLLLYVFIFMVDDLFVFFVAMLTLQATGISSKYSKFSNLFGGILIFILGILLLFKPELLMFA